MTGMKTLKDAVLLPVPRRVTARPGRLEPGALREVLLMGDAAVRLMPAARALQEAARREAGLD
jgi:hypothetical protein